jgi:hypothetical protein
VARERAERAKHGLLNRRDKQEKAMTDDQLRAWENEIEQAQGALAAACAALEADKQARSGSLWARFVGAVTETPAKREAADAQSKLDATQAQARRNAVQGAVAEAKRSLAADEAASAERARLQGLVGSLRARQAQVAEWHGAARDAVHALRRAASQCHSASSTDTMAAFSGNKGMDFMAYSSNSSAKSAVSDAKNALKRLANALPQEEIRALEADAPDGTLAFFLDLSGGFDFLDLVNASKMTKAARKCEAEADKVKPLRDRLEGMLGEATGAADEQEAKLRALERGFLDAAYGQVPVALQSQAPETLDA